MSAAIPGRDLMDEAMMRFSPLFFVFLLVPPLIAEQGDPKKKKGPDPLEGLKALQHPDPKVRYKAAQTLADLGPVAKFAVMDLRDALKDKNPFVRVKVAEALWKIEKTPAVTLMPVLMQVLKDKDPGARAAAMPVVAVFGVKASPAIPILVESLKDKSLEVRLAAIAALGDLGPVAKGTAMDLLSLTGDSDYFLMEPFVGAALGNLGPTTLPALTTALTDASNEKRRLAAYALGSMGPSAAPAAGEIAIAMKSNDAATRREAARALGKIGPAAKSAVPQLEIALADKETPVRIEAALAIWLVTRQPKHVGVLIKALDEESVGVRDAACQAIAAMKSDAKAAVGAVARLLGEKELRLRAVITLGEIGPGAAKTVSDMRNFWKEKDDGLRMWSAYAIWQITREAKDPLIVLNQTLATELHYTQSIVLLGEMGSAAEPLLQTLINLYREEDVPADRQALATAIKKIDPKAAMGLGIK